MLIIGSCKALNLRYSGCCDWRVSPSCRNNECFCDNECHTLNDCCSDIDDIRCHSSQDNTLGKTKSDDLVLH